jgi:hypothetical protein
MAMELLADNEATVSGYSGLAPFRLAAPGPIRSVRRYRALTYPGSLEPRFSLLFPFKAFASLRFPMCQTG